MENDQNQVTIDDVERWADSLGYSADSRLGRYRYDSTRSLYVVRDVDRKFGSPVVSVEGDDIIVSRADNDTWTAPEECVDAVLRMGGTIRWAEDTESGQALIVIQIYWEGLRAHNIELDILLSWTEDKLAKCDPPQRLSTVVDWTVAIRTYIVVMGRLKIRHPLELKHGPDIYVPTEHYDAVIQRIAGPSFWRPEWLIFETDLWKLSIYCGNRREREGTKRANWRWKKPYPRIRAEFLEAVIIVAHLDGGEKRYMIDPYNDAVDRDAAILKMRDNRHLAVVEIIERRTEKLDADGWPILEDFQATMTRATTRVLRLNQQS